MRWSDLPWSRASQARAASASKTANRCGSSSARRREGRRARRRRRPGRRAGTTRRRRQVAGPRSRRPRLRGPIRGGLGLRGATRSRSAWRRSRSLVARRRWSSPERLGREPGLAVEPAEPVEPRPVDLRQVPITRAGYSDEVSAASRARARCRRPRPRGRARRRRSRCAPRRARPADLVAGGEQHPSGGGAISKPGCRVTADRGAPGVGRTDEVDARRRAGRARATARRILSTPRDEGPGPRLLAAAVGVTAGVGACETGASQAGPGPSTRAPASRRRETSGTPGPRRQRAGRAHPEDAPSAAAMTPGSSCYPTLADRRSARASRQSPGHQGSRGLLHGHDLGVAHLERVGLGIRQSVTCPAARRSPSAAAHLVEDGLGPGERHRRISARIPTLASDFTLRTPASASPSAASIAASPPARSSARVGQAARCTEPSPNQAQTSSVA